MKNEKIIENWVIKNRPGSSFPTATMLFGYDALLELMQLAQVEAREEIKTFLKNWEEVEPHINGAFLMGHVHGNEYKGPVLDIGRLRKLV